MTATGRPLIFGEVLFDRFEDGSEVLGGAPLNVAWNLRGLGLDPLLVTRVGDDDAGRRIRHAMTSFGLDSAGVQIDADHPTGAVDVSIVDGEPRFEIVSGVAWDFIEPPDSAPAGPPSLVYHGSLALRSPVSAATARVLVDSAPPAPVFFDVNLRPPWWDRAAIADRLLSAHTVKLNEDELDTLAPDGEDLDGRARDLLERSSATNVVVTRGARGAVAFTRDGARALTAPDGSPTVVDTVGAGDAFSSVLILGLLQEWPLATMLDRAREFAEAVVGLRGATTSDADFYSRFRAPWSSA